jgi:hypothetical protein
LKILLPLSFTLILICSNAYAERECPKKHKAVVSCMGDSLTDSYSVCQSKKNDSYVVVHSGQDYSVGELKLIKDTKTWALEGINTEGETFAFTLFDEDLIPAGVKSLQTGSLGIRTDGMLNEKVSLLCVSKR